MSVLYLLTTPPPLFEGTDAVLQEASALREAFGGKIVNLSPLRTSMARFPKQFFGFHYIGKIRQLQRELGVTHVYFPSPYFFPVLRLLREPIFYTVAGSLDARRKPRAAAQLAKLRRVIVASERDARVLDGWGLPNHAIVRPGINTSAFVPAPLRFDRELILLMASAPWRSDQFELKGVDLLLAAAARLPFLKLILLWRGVLADELKQRIERLSIGARVEVVNRKVRVSEYLAKAHAAVLLTKNAAIVRAFPHSLIESLAAGKPVLVSSTIAMADYVTSNRCGLAIPDFSLGALTSGIELLMRNYNELAGKAARMRAADFSVGDMVEKHARLYGL
jgi:glycosyltransferase involved in cell wall biosynthesis